MGRMMQQLLGLTQTGAHASMTQQQHQLQATQQLQRMMQQAVCLLQWMQKMFMQAAYRLLLVLSPQPMQLRKPSRQRKLQSLASPQQ